MKMVRTEIVSLRGKGKDSSEAEKVRKEVARVRTEMEEIRVEVRKVREEMVALKGRMSDLVATSTRCTEKMTEGVELMMAMTKWLRARFPETPKELPKPSGDSTTPGQGSLIAQKPPHAPRPHTTPSPSRPVILKTAVPRPTEE
ncbi:uncharacterized protein LOC121764099 [Salvia splendens]|uniref:uncharacterized protein LOC121764099 n=1 Tax=Salvia splendens TaxID=180675 RepID=UPI001C256330|nr:uncharacterized protein LOC121764099 [Salvia splendens]